MPIDQGKITEPHRIDSALPTIHYILQRAKKAVIASHLGRPDGKIAPKYSLRPVRDYLTHALNRPVVLAPDCVGVEVKRIVGDEKHSIVLLENLRFHKEEEKNDPAFSRALASLADVYVNDAFGAAHRAHASIAGMAAFFAEKAAGLLLQKELEYLSPILTHPEKPFVMILGGAKVSDKIGVIKNLLSKVDALLIGGGMAYTFLKAQGIAVGKSLIEPDKIDLAGDILKEASNRGVQVLLPVDHVTGDAEKEIRSFVPKRFLRSAWDWTWVRKRPHCLRTRSPRQNWCSGMVPLGFSNCRLTTAAAARSPALSPIIILVSSALSPAETPSLRSWRRESRQRSATCLPAAGQRSSFSKAKSCQA